MLLSLEQIARALNGEIVRTSKGDQVKAPGPGHSAADRSLSVMIGDNGDIVVKVRAADDRT